MRHLCLHQQGHERNAKLPWQCRQRLHSTCALQQYVQAPWVLVHEVCDVQHLAVDDQPTVVLPDVFLALLQADHTSSAGRLWQVCPWLSRVVCHLRGRKRGCRALKPGLSLHYRGKCWQAVWSSGSQEDGWALPSPDFALREHAKRGRQLATGATGTDRLP